MDSRATSTLSTELNPTLMYRVGRFSRLPGCLGQINGKHQQLSVLLTDGSNMCRPSH